MAAKASSHAKPEVSLFLNKSSNSKLWSCFQEALAIQEKKNSLRLKNRILSQLRTLALLLRFFLVFILRKPLLQQGQLSAKIYADLNCLMIFLDASKCSVFQDKFSVTVNNKPFGPENYCQNLFFFIDSCDTAVHFSKL